MHGKLVVDQLKDDDQIKEFIKRWRLFFVNNMKPRFLPQAWSVEHKFCREFGE